MSPHVDPGVLALCPELVALVQLERTLLDAARAVSLAFGGGPELVCARLTLEETLDELLVALRGYHELRVSAATAQLPF